LVLLLAVILGLLAAWIRASLGKRRLHNPHIKHLWLILAAYLPQAIAFSFPTRRSLPDTYAAAALIGSLGLLLVFVWFNKDAPGFWALGLGLGLNLIVIAINGGFMPISPDTLKTWSPEVPTGAWEIGKRFGTGKDIVLTTANTRLWFLSDRFLTPQGFPIHIAFSLGDIFIALGAFLLLWSLGSNQPQE
jgi:hypothetical protein